MGFKIVDSCKAILILVFSLCLDALFLLMWMIALLLETRPIALTKLKHSLHEGDENFVLQDEGLIDKYL
jgi:hypothetical protein